jgi:hypothetical protein
MPLFTTYFIFLTQMILGVPISNNELCYFSYIFGCNWRCASSNNSTETHVTEQAPYNDGFDLIFFVLTPLAAIFQLYHGDHF